jgi:hypothetical protein
MAILGYPNPVAVGVVGYASATQPSLEAYGLKIAKLVYAQFLERTVGVPPQKRD